MRMLHKSLAFARRSGPRPPPFVTGFAPALAALHNERILKFAAPCPRTAMEVPTLEYKPLSKIHLIEGENGGVGKSMVSRLLAQ